MFRILFILLLSYNLIAQENIIRNFIDNGKIDSAVNLDLEQDKFLLDFEHQHSIGYYR